jgi:adenine-specific DNA-methyltransferase
MKKKLINKDIGQVFTPEKLSSYMSSLFSYTSNQIKLLDPGCGNGNLSISFLDLLEEKNFHEKVTLDLYDIDNMCLKELKDRLKKRKFKNLVYNIKNEDYILNSSIPKERKSKNNNYTHIIMNPPYKKINKGDSHRIKIESLGLKTVNLYSSFVMMSILQLCKGGEIVFIVPRSFTNGLYYKSFRNFLLKNLSIKQVHIFNNRNDVFKKGSVLQETIILHGVKDEKQSDVLISSSETSNFEKTSKLKFKTPDYKEFKISFHDFVDPNDKESFFKIVKDKEDLEILKKSSIFKTSIDELGVQVSTGPVVQHRLKMFLSKEKKVNGVPFISSKNFSEHKIFFPKQNQYNYVVEDEKTKGSLFHNKDYFLLIKRFSSKEEKRRLSTVIYKSINKENLVGFDNMINVFHSNKSGLSKDLVLGLMGYLNSSFVDKYYRLFGGHTQINSTDLRNIKYPNLKELIVMGKKLGDCKDIKQEEIDIVMNSLILKKL